MDAEMRIGPEVEGATVDVCSAGTQSGAAGDEHRLPKPGLGKISRSDDGGDNYRVTRVAEAQRAPEIKSLKRDPGSAPLRLPRFKFLTAQQIVTLPPPTWLIDGLIAEDTLAVLYGPPGAGKSFVAQEWALSVAGGHKTLGREVRQGDVAYVYAEGGGGMPLRLRAWEAKRGTLPVRFFGMPSPVDMTVADEVDDLIDDMMSAEIQPALIVIDTLARCFGAGNENVQQDMNAFVRGCDAVRRAFSGAAILVVHHTGWDASRERGSNALRAASDTMIRLARENGAILLRVERQKDAPVEEEATVLALEYVPVPGSKGSCVVALGEPSLAHRASRPERQGQRPATSDTKAIDALKAAGSSGLASGAWRERSGLKSSTFKDARRRLEKRGEVIRSGDCWAASELVPGATAAIP